MEQAEEIDFVPQRPHPTWDRPMQAEEYLHAQARKCQRLASESLDVFVREALIELASDYEHLAERLKQQRQNLN